MTNEVLDSVESGTSLPDYRDFQHRIDVGIAEAFGLRQVDLSDADHLKHLVANNHYHFFEQYQFTDEPYGGSDQLPQHIEAQNEQNALVGIWKECTMIGMIAIKQVEADAHELKFWLDFQHQGEGFMCVSVWHLIRYLREQHNLSKFVVRVDAQNYHSAKVLQKNSFDFDTGNGIWILPAQVLPERPKPDES